MVGSRREVQGAISDATENIVAGYVTMVNLLEGLEAEDFCM